MFVNASILYKNQDICIKNKAVKKFQLYISLHNETLLKRSKVVRIHYNVKFTQYLRNELINCTK